MKIQLLLLILLFIFTVACKKNASQTRPQISIESINTTITPGGSLDAHLKFTDNKGDLGQGVFIAIRIRLNQRPLPIGTGGVDTLIASIPDFPNQNQGQFEFTQGYTYLNQSDQENDTIIFKFAVIDRAGNKSDTISSNKIIVQ